MTPDAGKIARVLDVGCGRGACLFPAAGAGGRCAAAQEMFVQTALFVVAEKR